MIHYTSPPNSATILNFTSTPLYRHRSSMAVEQDSELLNVVVFLAADC